MEALQRLHNRGSISTGYNIDNSLKVEADNSEYAEYAITSTTDRRNFCFSGWVKRTELVNATDGGQLIFGSFTEGNEGVLLRWSRENSNYYDGIQVDIGQGGTNYRSYTSSVYRDTSAWYHIVLAVNTRENTASNRWKLYVNGEQVTSWAQQQFPTADFLTSANLSGSKHSIGAYETGGTVYGKNCGYFADFHFIDADQGNVTFLPTDFGEYDEDSGIWKPIEVDVTYGTNGFYLDFADASDLGDDESGNGNDFTETNITAADQATDTPTNNFATLNPLHAYSGTTSHNPTFVEGATRFATTRSGYWHTAIANIGITSGKWYFEVQPGTSNSHITGVGYGDESDIHDWGQNIADTHGFLGETSTNSIGYLGSDTETTYGNVWLGTGSKSGANNSANYTISNIVGVAIDADNGYIYFAKDNTYINSGNPGSGSNGTGGDKFEDTTTTRTGTVFAGVSAYHHTAAGVMNVNFGGYTTISISSAASDANGYGTFEYAPPSGYYALCTKNLEVYG